jgi:hypothetical protein
LRAKADRKSPKILALSAFGVVCFAALIYGLSGGSSQRQSDAPLAALTPAVTPSESPTLVDVATPSAVRSVNAQGKKSGATRSAIEAGSAQLNSAASHAPAPTVETAPVRSLAPKPKRVEETFYITRTGKRYHRAGCPSLRYSAYPITRAEAEAQGYTPCRVCYP